jgi:hypothetical protein
MTQQYLFARAYALTLSDPRDNYGLQYGNLVSGQSALRIRFEVKQGVKDTPNTAKITVFNLSETSRSAISANGALNPGKGAVGAAGAVGTQIKLVAGYQGLVDTLFFGSAFKVTTKRDGPDITTEIEATDGQEALLNATFNQRYPKDTDLWRILRDVAKAMSVDIGVVVGLPDYKLSRSQTLTGGCRQVLTDCLGRHGIEFNVLNNKLNMMPKGRHLGHAAIVVSPLTGMVGVPSITDEGVTFDSLLNPKLIPGQLVQVVSQNQKAVGFYKLRAATFVGDSHADDWKVTAECARLPDGAVQALTPARGFDFAAATVPGLI